MVGKEQRPTLALVTAVDTKAYLLLRLEYDGERRRPLPLKDNR